MSNYEMIGFFQELQRLSSQGWSFSRGKLDDDLIFLDNTRILRFSVDREQQRVILHNADVPGRIVHITLHNPSDFYIGYGKDRTTLECRFNYVTSKGNPYKAVLIARNQYVS